MVGVRDHRHHMLSPSRQRRRRRRQRNGGGGAVAHVTPPPLILERERRFVRVCVCTYTQRMRVLGTKSIQWGQVRIKVHNLAVLIIVITLKQNISST